MGMSLGGTGTSLGCAQGCSSAFVSFTLLGNSCWVFASFFLVQMKKKEDPVSLQLEDVTPEEKQQRVFSATQLLGAWSYARAEAVTSSTDLTSRTHTISLSGGDEKGDRRTFNRDCIAT